MTEISEIQEIKAVSNGIESECACTQCQNMCKTAPCLGTPADIKRLVDNGYSGKLSITAWGVGQFYGLPIIYMVQPTKTPTGCVFLKDDKCTLHESGLKPTEGKLTKGCEVDIVEKNKLPVNFAVARTWLLEGNQRTVHELFKQIAGVDGSL
jgi:hypothetical protein